jgi:hypothetical protein
MPLIRAQLSSQGGLRRELVALEYGEWIWRSAIIFIIMRIHMNDEKNKAATISLKHLI